VDESDRARSSKGGREREASSAQWQRPKNARRPDLRTLSKRRECGSLLFRCRGAEPIWSAEGGGDCWTMYPVRRRSSKIDQVCSVLGSGQRPAPPHRTTLKHIR
jgi:hypothetical protein